MNNGELAAWMALERIPIATGPQATGALEEHGDYLRLALEAKNRALCAGCPEEITATCRMVADATARCGEWLA